MSPHLDHAAYQLPPEQYDTANVLLQQLLTHYGLESVLVRRRYKPAKLIQAMFESMAAKHSFLKFFFSFAYDHLQLSQDTVITPNLSRPLSYFHGFLGWDSNQKSDLNGTIEAFAAYIVDNFLLPLRVSATKTPQPTPTSLSPIQASTPTGTLRRVSGLRQSCLVRDHHRCIISGCFDNKEADRRYEEQGGEYQDDTGGFLKMESGDDFAFLEVAHILPHGLTTVSPGEADLSDSKKIVLQILDLFDPGIIYLIDGPAIDSPQNALTLSTHYHQLFGQFQIHFEATGQRDEYRIDLSSQPKPHLRKRQRSFPSIRRLPQSPDGSIDLPSARLLGIHRAIATIMRLSGAGGYIDSVLQDMEEAVVKADGSTNLGSLVGLKLNGWTASFVH